jgi:GT2 family glycosyltransferase
VDGERITLRVGPRVIEVAVDPGDSPADFRVPNQYEPAHADRSDRLRFTLERLHREHRLGRIEFGVYGGLAFRSVQAKRAGLAFADVTLAVRLDSCGKWERELRQRWPSGFEEVEVDHAERFAFENADERVTPDAALFDFVRRAGWEVMSVAHASGSDTTPLVTIGIAHHNLGAYLPETLASLAAQSYPHLDVVVIDDGSTDARALAVFEQMREKYPGFRFLRQANAGIGATRNRCLELARGEFFVPVDADNVARPEMVERLVRAIRQNPHLAAMTCYYLAFEDTPDRPVFAGRPAGGPHTLAGIRNVYGDANAVFRTAALRAVGGYETDRGTSCEDWEAFVKLVNAGERIGVVPEHLFHYRHRPAGFSRRTNWFANHQRVLRQFTRNAPLPAGEAEVLWTALLGFHLRLQQLERTPPPLRHRVADRLHAAFGRVPGVLRGLKRLLTCRRRAAACRASP